MAVENYANGCSTTVTGGYTPGSGVLNVASTASPFPATGNYRVIILDSTFTSVKVVLKVTAVNSSTQFAVTAEGTDASGSDGDPVRGTEITAAMLDAMRSDMSAQGADASLPATTGHKSGDTYVSNNLPYMYVFDGAAWTKFPVGGIVLLEQHTASVSATLDFTTAITSAFDSYLIEVVGIVVATNGAKVQVRLSTDGGSTYIATASYSWISAAASRTAVGANGADGATSMLLINDVQNGTGQSLDGSCTLYHPGSGATLWTQLVGQFLSTTSGTVPISWTFAGALTTTPGAVNAFRIMASSGNLTSGTVRCYGISKGFTI